MMKASEQNWERLSRLIAARMGLHYTKDRWADLKRGIGLAGRELGLSESDEIVRHLLARPLDERIIALLARHLTVGETYFFRDPKMLAALEKEILPPLLKERRQIGRCYLNIWSAACCTGEEPYTIAILLARLIPDLANWQLRIFGTDINPQFLAKARTGIFPKWSFRGSSAAFIKSYFSITPDRRHALLPKYRQMVRFSLFNLLDETGLPPEISPGEVDVIFCRNVLMYFSPAQSRQVIAKLKEALAPGGWLIASAAEAGPAFAPLEAVHFEGAMAYHKVLPPKKLLPKPVETPLPGSRIDSSPRGSAKKRAKVAVAGNEAKELSKIGLLQKQAQQLADGGKLTECLKLCDEALAIDKMSASLHYLRSSVLQEQGASEEAIAALRRALYLDPKFAVGYFALGCLMGRLGRKSEQAKYFDSALQLLEKRQSDEALVDFSGMTAGRLAEMIRSTR